MNEYLNMNIMNELLNRFNKEWNPHYYEIKFFINREIEKSKIKMMENKNRLTGHKKLKWIWQNKTKKWLW